MTKNAIDVTKADKSPSGIVDITKIPDVSLWSKEVTTGNVTSVGMPLAQGIISIEKPSLEIENLNTPTTEKLTKKGRKRKEGSESRAVIVDPANPKEISAVINSKSSITDKTKAFSTISNKSSSGTSKVMRTSDKNKIIKFHGTEVKNVIILYTISKGPRNVVKKEFDALKIKIQFETVNIQIVTDYITITFYKEEQSNLILQRELVPAHRVEYIWFKDL